MSGDAVITFSGKADQLLQTYTQMNSANATYDKGLLKLQISTKELNKLEREGLAITKMNLTAKERYTENVNLARRALDHGKISMESYNRELSRQKQLLDQAEGGGQRFTGVLKGIGAAAGVAVAGIQALIAEEQKLANIKRAAADANVAYGEILARTVNNFSDDATM